MKKKKFVYVTIELPMEVIAQLALLAHESNMLLNDFINKILEEQIKKIEIKRKQAEHGIII